MKQNPELEIIQANMMPGTLSAHGFLGTDSRNLADILRSDADILVRLALTGQQLADKMRDITACGTAELGRPVIYDRLYEVEVEDYMGEIPCPFQDNVKVDKRQTIARRLDSGLILRWTDLNIHMIEKHHFFEGLGSNYRLDPLELARFLNLTSQI